MSDAEPTKTTTAAPPASSETAAVDKTVKAETVEPAQPTPATAPTTSVAAAAVPTPSPVVGASTATTEAPAKAEEKEANTEEVKPPTKTEEAVEPQNALTERFTAAEWTALKEFRKQLPEIFEAAFKDTDKPERKTAPYNLWGVTIDPTNPLNAKTSVVLMKFLRARALSITAAKDMLTATLRWRDEFNVEAACKEEFPNDVFGKIGHIFGKDKEGRPVVYNVYGGNQDIKAVFGDVDRFLRWRVAFMEKGLETLDFETVDQQIQVHDYEGVSMTSRDANSKNAASQASSIFGAHYPELLYKKFFINVPSLMTWIFWLFKPIIPAATLAKMSVVGSGAHTIGKSLLPLIDANELPDRYGGKAKAF